MDEDNDIEIIEEESSTSMKRPAVECNNSLSKKICPSPFLRIQSQWDGNVTRILIPASLTQLGGPLVRNYEPLKTKVQDTMKQMHTVKGCVTCLMQKLKNVTNLTEKQKALCSMAVDKVVNGKMVYKLPSTVPKFIPPKLNGQLPKESNTGADGLQIVSMVRVDKTQTVPPVGPIKHGELTVGTRVYAMKKDLCDVWHKAVIVGFSEGPKRTYNIKFDNSKSGTIRIRSLKQLAHFNSLTVQFSVRRRILAAFRPNSDTSCDMYAGVVAEPPKSINKFRYLIFFDDGYAQYTSHQDIRLVYDESKNVWEDISIDNRNFIKTYCEQYPERPMLKLQIGQAVKTEYNGQQWVAKVLEIDASLVHMQFAGGREEWIYRGSTRLDALNVELEAAKQKRLSGKVRRHNITPKSSNENQPYVEYTMSYDDVVNVSDESCDGSNVVDKPAKVQKAKKSTTQIKAMRPIDDLNSSSKLLQGEHYTVHFDDFVKPKFVQHTCSFRCRKEAGYLKYKGKNPLLIPMYLGWERQIRAHKNNKKQCKHYLTVQYRAPCGRTLRNIEELNNYLLLIRSRIGIGYFAFDSEILTRRAFRIAEEDKLYCDDDITNGEENLPIACVNTLKNEAPVFVEYSAKRFPSKDVAHRLNLDKEFLCGCDCTDNCQDWRKCQCQQLTYKASCSSKNDKHEFPGYHYKRLKEPVLTGIYECNERCHCHESCMNRVVQNGIQVRLQMFQTLKKGWGIRCLDDIDAGMHICIYAGQLLTDQGADEDGNQYGDEYLAELDHIEVAEKIKEGYESDVPFSLEDNKVQIVTDSSTSSEEFSEMNDSDSEYDANDFERFSKFTYSTRKRNNKKKDSTKKSKDGTNKSKDHSSDSLPQTNTLPDLDKPSSYEDLFFYDHPPLSPNTLSAIDKMKLEIKPNTEQNIKCKKSTKRTGSDLPAQVKEEDKKANTKYISVRKYFGEEDCYIMDAKIKGNIGRYLNHSCVPNCFVQNVFIETHDLRFPHVAFFALSRIKAGTELTWDYNYTVGSVPNKTLLCYCETPKCKGRLL